MIILVFLKNIQVGKIIDWNNPYHPTNWRFVGIIGLYLRMSGHTYPDRKVLL
jgi:hypothetical protein